MDDRECLESLAQSLETIQYPECKTGIARAEVMDAQKSILNLALCLRVASENLE